MLNVQTLSGVDPTGASDSTAAIQNVLNSATGDLALAFPYGHYLINGLTWNLPYRLTLCGDGPSSWLTLNGTSGSIFIATNGFVTIENFSVNGQAANYVTSGTFFVFSGGRHMLRHLDVYNAYSIAAWNNGCTGGGAEYINAVAVACNGLAVNVSQSSAGQQYGILEFSHLNFQGSPSNAGIGLSLTSGDTVIVSDSNIAGFATNVSAVTNSSYSYLANLFFTNVLCDGAGGPSNSTNGWYFDGASGFLSRVFMTNCWGGSMGTNGIHLVNVKTMLMRGCNFISNGANGVMIDTGCREVKLIDSVITGNSVVAPGHCHGVVVLGGADRIHLHSNRCGPTYNGVNLQTTNDTQGYGIIVDSSTVVNYSILNNDCAGNTISSLSNLGGGTPNVTAFVSGNTTGTWSS